MKADNALTILKKSHYFNTIIFITFITCNQLKKNIYVKISINILVNNVIVLSKPFYIENSHFSRLKSTCDF